MQELSETKIKFKKKWRRINPNVRAILIIILFFSIIFGIYSMGRVIYPKSVVHIKTNPNFLQYTNATYNNETLLLWTSLSVVSTSLNEGEMIALSSLMSGQEDSLMLLLAQSTTSTMPLLVPSSLLGFFPYSFTIPRGENVVALALTYSYKYNSTSPTIFGLLIYPIATNVSDIYIAHPQNDISIWSKEFYIYLVNMTSYNDTLSPPTLDMQALQIGEFGMDYFDFFDLFKW